MDLISPQDQLMMLGQIDAPPLQSPQMAPQAPMQQPMQMPMTSPFAAGYGALTQMLGAFGAGRAPTTDPATAMNRQAQLNFAQMQNAQLNQFRMERLQRQDNPAYEFNLLKDQGLIPKEMSFAEYMALGNKTSAPAAVREYQFFSNLSPEEQERFLQMKRANQLTDLGGGGVGLLDPSGRLRTVVDASAATGRDATRAGAIEAAKGVEGNLTQDFNTFKADYLGQREMYRDLDNRLVNINEGIAMFDGEDPSKQVDTGPLAGFWDGFLRQGGVDTGRLRTMSLQEALAALAAFKGPTTDFEFTKAELSAFASLYQNEEVNLGTLRTVRDALERSKQEIERSSQELYEGMRSSARPGEFERIQQAFPPLDDWEWSLFDGYGEN